MKVRFFLYDYGGVKYNRKIRVYVSSRQLRKYGFRHVTRSRQTWGSGADLIATRMTLQHGRVTLLIRDYHTIRPCKIIHVYSWDKKIYELTCTSTQRFQAIMKRLKIEPIKNK